MTTTEIITLVATVLVSPAVYLFIVQLIKRPDWHPLFKAALAIVVSGAVAIAQTWITGDLQNVIASWGTLTAAEIVAYWGVIYASGQIVYNAIGGAEFMQKLREWPT